MPRFIFGTRGSDLALAQTAQAENRMLSLLKVVECERKIIKSTGDMRLDVDLASPGKLEKGLFTKELEDALYAGEIDFAIHSLKDLPTELPDGLILGAVLPRAATEDVLLSRHAGGVDGLPEGARVGSGSPRREMQLRLARRDVTVVPIRGNVPTRIRKLATEPGLDAIILAQAGLERLGLMPYDGHFRQDGLVIHATRLPFLPAPGQGAIAIEVSADSHLAVAAASRIECADTRITTSAERQVLQDLGGGCALPLGALGSIHGGVLRLEAIYQHGDGAKPVTRAVEGPVADWRRLSRYLAAELSEV